MSEEGEELEPVDLDLLEGNLELFLDESNKVDILAQFRIYVMHTARYWEKRLRRMLIFLRLIL